jgi:hypothetical protein
MSTKIQSVRGRNSSSLEYNRVTVVYNTLIYTRPRCEKLKGSKRKQNQFIWKDNNYNSTNNIFWSFKLTYSLYDVSCILKSEMFIFEQLKQISRYQSQGKWQRIPWTQSGDLKNFSVQLKEQVGNKLKTFTTKNQISSKIQK